MYITYVLEVKISRGPLGHFLPPSVYFFPINLLLFISPSPSHPLLGKWKSECFFFFSFRDLQFRLNEPNMPQVRDKIMSRIHSTLEFIGRSM